MAQTPHEIQAQILKKGKRTKRVRPSSASSSSTADCSSSTAGFTEEEEEDHDLANCLILLAQGKTGDFSSVLVNSDDPSSILYQCKTCDRCFPSFQALGGHRASHKKPKILTTVSDSVHLSLQLSTGSPAPASFPAGDAVKSKVHECSICGAEFSSGQALGGHMRRHRALTTATAAAVGSSGAVAPPRLPELVIKKQRNVLELDLNLPAPEEDRHRPAVAVGGFSAASALVDCHY